LRRLRTASSYVHRESGSRIWRRHGINQVERAVLGVVVELFQDPRLNLRAAIRKRDAVELVLDNSFGSLEACLVIVFGATTAGAKIAATGAALAVCAGVG